MVAPCAPEVCVAIFALAASAPVDESTLKTEILPAPPLFVLTTYAKCVEVPPPPPPLFSLVKKAPQPARSQHNRKPTMSDRRRIRSFYWTENRVRYTRPVMRFLLIVLFAAASLF